MGLYGQYRSLINDGGLNGDKNNDKSTNGNNKGKIMINKNIKNTNNNIPKNNNISTSK